MTKQEIQNYRNLINKLNCHEKNQHADMVSITLFFNDIFDYSLHVSKMIKRIPTIDLSDYNKELSLCNYDVEFIKRLRDEPNKGS